MQSCKSRRHFLKSTAAASFIIPASATLQASAAPKTTSKTARFHLGCCAYSYRKYLKSGEMKLEDFMRLAADLGFDGVQLTTYYYESTDDDYLFGLKQLAYKLGLDIPSIAIRTNFCIAGTDEREHTVEDTKKWIDVAVKLGATAIRIFGGKIPKDSSVDEAIEWTTAGIREAVGYAGSQGIFLALEDHGGVTERAEYVLKIHSQVNHKWFGLLLDTGNFASDPYKQIAMVAPYAITTHLKGTVVGPNGSRQKSDMDRVLKILHDAHYRGYLNIEYEGEEDPMTGVPKLLKELKQVAANYSLI